MFKLAQTPTYTWPVTVQLAADGGHFERHVFDVEFRRLPQSAIQDLVRNGETDIEVARRLITGWNHVMDAEGAPLPFSEGNLGQFLDVPGMASAIVRAYFDSLSGAARKN